MDPYWGEVVNWSGPDFFGSVFVIVRRTYKKYWMEKMNSDHKSVQELKQILFFF